MSEPRHQPHAAHLLLSAPFGPVAAPGAALQAGDLWLGGFHVNEATGAAVAAVQLLDGNDANGVPVTGVINLAINAGLPVNFGGHMLAIRTGLFVRVLAGSVQGAVYLADR